ncbi:MAG: phosphatidylserine/phosphatidylglycerophosphate/cardiolipin synthase family protein [Acidobacteria bacterium]|nr:phosphatidylserine/phosphatidylglycerophosphate/cardiolipin synthase family protein [Acidobacteriota bacterium]
MSIRLLVDAAEFWPAFEADARTATTRLYVQTLSFEGDTAGQGLADLFLALGPIVDRRLIIDHYTRYFINDRFLYAPGALADGDLWREAKASRRLVDMLERDGVRIHWTNPIGWRIYRTAARNHKKIFVVDDRVAYIGGINLSEHNFAWHDVMLRVDDPAIIACLTDDFLQTCEGRNQALDRTFDEGRLILLDGHHGDELLKDLFDMIANAREEVIIESPYVSAPFMDPMRTAAARGVRMVILVPEINNWGWYDAYAKLECFRRKIELRYYIGPMNHTKCMLIDKRVLVTGSSNFDYFTYYTHQELLWMTTHEPLVSEFRRRIFDPDMASSREAPLADDFSWQTHWTSIRVRSGYPSLKWFNRHL